MPQVFQYAASAFNADSPDVFTKMTTPLQVVILSKLDNGAIM
jgi:hypothetical protein